MCRIWNVYERVIDPTNDEIGKHDMLIVTNPNDV